MLLLHPIFYANRDDIAITQFQKQVDKITDQKTGKREKQLSTQMWLSIQLM